MGDLIGAAKLHPVGGQHLLHRVPFHDVVGPLPPVHLQAHLEGVPDGDLAEPLLIRLGIGDDVLGGDPDLLVGQDLHMVLLPGDGDGGAVPVDDVHHVVQVGDGEDDGGEGHGGDPRQGGGTEDTASGPLRGAEEEGEEIPLDRCCHGVSFCSLGLSLSFGVP